MYEQDYKQDVGVVSLAIHARGYKRFTPGERDKLCKGARTTLRESNVP